MICPKTPSRPEAGISSGEGSLRAGDDSQESDTESEYAKGVELKLKNCVLPLMRPQVGKENTLKMRRKPATRAEKDRVEQDMVASEGRKDRGRDKVCQSPRGTGMNGRIGSRIPAPRADREKPRTKTGPGR